MLYTHTHINMEIVELFLPTNWQYPMAEEASVTNMKIKIKQRIDFVDVGNVQTVQAKITIVPFFFFQIVRQAQFNYIRRDWRDSAERERERARARDRTTMNIKHETEHF